VDAMARARSRSSFRLVAYWRKQIRFSFSSLIQLLFAPASPRRLIRSPIALCRARMQARDQPVDFAVFLFSPVWFTAEAPPDGQYGRRGRYRRTKTDRFSARLTATYSVSPSPTTAGEHDGHFRYRRHALVHMILFEIRGISLNDRIRHPGVRTRSSSTASVSLST